MPGGNAAQEGGAVAGRGALTLVLIWLAALLAAWLYIFNRLIEGGWVYGE